MNGHGEKLSRKMEPLIAALLTQPTISQAAQVAGISEATARRWLRREEFLEHYRKARLEVVSHAVARLQHASHQAVDTLIAVMADSEAPAAARVSAGKAALDIGREEMLEEYEAKMAKAEKVLERLIEAVYGRQKGKAPA